MTFDQINEFDFFTNCGESISLDSISLKVKELSFEQVFVECSSIDYEDFQMERCNEIGYSLSSNIERYKEWNNHVQDAKSILESKFQLIERQLGELGFGSSVISSVHWDIISYFVELAYADIFSEGYYTKLLGVYKAGLLPVGYSGEYPEGFVLVY